MNFVSFNGKFFAGDEPVLPASNKSYRYGDGLFETMKVTNGKILLGDLHFDRLFAGLDLLKFSLPQNFTSEELTRAILHLCERNECLELGRVRCSVSRGEGGLYDENGPFNLLIEAWSIDKTATEVSPKGIIIDIYDSMRKSQDKFANLKSASALPYVMASLYAKENKMDDCLLLNTDGYICDSTIANVFIINGGKIFTPGLDQGCVSGVMRRNLIEKRKLKIIEKEITVQDLLKADEIFLSNAIKGLISVREFRKKSYSNSFATALQQELY